MSSPTTAAAPFPAADNVTFWDHQHIVPVAFTHACPLTEDEARRQCQVMRLPAAETSLDQDAYAVVEPVAAWQWLAKGTLCVLTTLYEFHDMPGDTSSMFYRVLATTVGRILSIDPEYRMLEVTTEAEPGGFTVWALSDVLNLWTIVRTVAIAEERTVEAIEERPYMPRSKAA
ncbi:hypothetical protein GCM10022408_37530 [Hymenobacter fastidiosus]|uniref:Uncharacterized protein n=1 Tax=Hymenobacter fastidiosus TaxID=486264 RepID=A0ABP7T265_9BACT